MNSTPLDRLRRRIDKLDSEILKLLAKRMVVSKKIGKVKSVLKLPPFQPTRWREVLQNRIELGEKLGLRRIFVQMIWTQIHDESLAKQKQVEI